MVASTRAEAADPMSTHMTDAIRWTLGHEGGWSDDQADPGGPTRYGISLRWLQDQGIEVGDIDRDGDIDAGDVRGLTPAMAFGLYRDRIWGPTGIGRLPPAAACKTFDCAVNMGPRQGIRCLQRALRAAAGTGPDHVAAEHAGLADDGIKGPLTEAAAWAIAERPVVAAMGSEMAGVYRQIVARRPESGRFLAGWLKRAYAPIPSSLWRY